MKGNAPKLPPHPMSNKEISSAIERLHDHPFVELTLAKTPGEGLMLMLKIEQEKNDWVSQMLLQNPLGPGLYRAAFPPYDPTDPEERAEGLDVVELFHKTFRLEETGVQQM